MNKIKSTLLMLLLSTQVFAGYTLTDLAGTYEITHPQLPVKNTVTLTATGQVSLQEESPFGSIICEGMATIKKDLLTSEVQCDNGAVFTQEINFAGIELASEFQAPVYSSLYDAEAVMNFTKI